MTFDLKYNIISINDDRAEYKKRIRERVGHDEVHIPATDASKVDLGEELDKRGLKITYEGMFRRGEIGVWLSNYDCWKWAYDNDEDLIVFEDDAIPERDFDEKLQLLYSELPPDWDFLTLWIPPNQLIDYVYDVEFDDEGQPTHVGPNLNSITSRFNFGSIRLARVYNGYGNVAQLYSPKGAGKFIRRVEEAGIYTPVDCFVYQEAHAGRAFGYAPKPNRAKLVNYDWAPTTIHETEKHI